MEFKIREVDISFAQSIQMFTDTLERALSGLSQTGVCTRVMLVTGSSVPVTVKVD